MHFAYPPRKSSNPTPYLPRSRRIPSLRRSRLRAVAIVGLALLLLIWLLTRNSGSGPAPKRVISGEPPVVIVTVLDAKVLNGQVPGQLDYVNDIKDNRFKYAKMHGYEVHIGTTDDYPNTVGSPKSWSKVPAMRHAMAKYPDAKYFWYLDQNSFIMNPKLKIEDYVMSAKNLEGNMIKDWPVVPPDSIIKTFSHLKADDIDLVLTQDNDGLSTGSFIIRNGEWAEFFLDTWFDPLYRSYNFQKAETHALEHIVQWHPTILSKLALIPQRVINSYSRSLKGDEYQAGELAVRFQGCSNGQGETSCIEEAKPYTSKWRKAFEDAS